MPPILAARISRLIPIGLLALAAACGGGDQRQAAEVSGPPTPGGTATLGILTDFQGFNPISTSNITAIDVIQQMLYTPIIRYDAELSVQPGLATSWELADTSVTFHLRTDLKWHDGQPVTAEDVKFSFDLAKNPETASLIGSAYVSLVNRATVLDSATVRFHFSAPHAQALEDFWWSPVPQHLLKDVAPAEMAQAAFNSKPVGNGPFRFVSWQRNQQLVLEANPDYPEELGGRPSLDRVIFRIIPEPTTMLTELLNGSVDFIGYTLLPDQAAQLQNQRGVDLRHFPSREFTYIAWNTKRPQFSDERVRRALAMAIDRPRLIEALMHGFAKPAVGMIPPWSPMYSEVAPLPFDPAAAKQLLAAAGWADSNGDGVVEKNGQPLSFTLMLNANNGMHSDIATVVQSQLKEVGVDARIRTAEFQSLLQQYRGRDFDAVISNWTLDTFKVDPTPLFSCAEAAKPGSANRTGFCDPAIDRLIQQGVRGTDPVAAKRVWAEFTQQLQQHQPITFLFWSEDLAGLGPRLQNVVMDARGKLVNIDRWWIPKEMQRR
jgi:peptide/nickel transport system substrate-binding protein